MDWEPIEREYITTNATYKELAEKYNVDVYMLRNKGRAGNWFDRKKQYFAENNMQLKGVGHLKTMKERTVQEAREYGRKGGVNSGKTRKGKKSARECMNALLNLDIKDEKIRKSLEEFGVGTEDLQNKMLLMFQLMKNGIKTGDAGTIKSILEIAGEFSAQQEEISPTINITISEATEEDRSID